MAFFSPPEAMNSQAARKQTRALKQTRPMAMKPETVLSHR